MFTLVLTALFLLGITIQLWYILHFFAQIFQKQHRSENINDPLPVSVIICARNEAQNLRDNLPLVLAQRYANQSGKSMYEVIVVNDASEDDSEKVLYDLGQRYDNLKIVTIPKEAVRTMPGKKFALSKAVAQAQHDFLLFTDADCKPAGTNWLAGMVAPLHQGKEVVTGVGRYLYQPGMLNAFIRWETLHTFLQYSSYAALHKPYMAVGRNLACTRQAFLKAQNSEVWNLLPSGDDDLLMRTIANGQNTTLVTEPETFTFSPAKSNWNEWVMQKQRHLSTGKYYKPGIKALLSVYASSHALVWLTFIALLFTGNWALAIGAMLCRGIVYWLVWQEAARRLEEKDLTSMFPVFDLGWMIYNFAFSPYIIFKNKQAWK